MNSGLSHGSSWGPCTKAMRLFLLLLATLIPRGASTAETVQFPILAWNPFPNDPAVFARLRECGFTHAGFVAPEALDNVHAAGLKAIVQDPRASGYVWTNVDSASARTRVAELVKATAHHPAVFGYYLVDEPSAAAFPGLAVVSRHFRELAPQHWAYINLFPTYASNEQLATASYREYLDRYLEACQPKILSYDHYALPEGGGWGDQFWWNLEEVSTASRRAQIPFWNIVLSVGAVAFRVPNDADLRLQAYATLAYGAGGLTWFTYLTPHVGNFREAPVDPFGAETPTWGRLQHVNRQVQSLAPTLKQLRHDRTYHFAPLPRGTRGPETESLLQDAGGMDILAADFTHADGSRYVMVVNRNLERSLIAHDLTFRTAPARVDQVSPWTGRPHPFVGEHRWISPGAGVLLRLVAPTE